MNKRRIAVWLDRSKARFMAVEPVVREIKTITSDYEPRPREEGEGADVTQWGTHPAPAGIQIGKSGVRASSNEDRKQNKLRTELDDYYDVLEALLKEYDEILLLGPSTAKSELKNRLENGKHFSDKTIHTEAVDTMTDNQLIAYVRGYFDKNR